MDLKSKLEDLRRRVELVYATSSRKYLESDGACLPHQESVEGSEVCIEGETFFHASLDLASAIPEFRQLHREYLEALASPFFPAAMQLEPLRSLKSVQPDSILYLDIETTGLSASVPLFLVGLMHTQGEELVIDQLLARDYSEERAILTFLGSMLPRFSLVVTFNGRSFDIPYIQQRMVVQRLPTISLPVHLDMLAIARAYLGSKMPNHRLQTLELYLCGRKRVGDIPGSSIPAAYHEYVRTGNCQEIAAIMYHNKMDLLTMMELVTLFLSSDF